ncbi:Proton/glutamate-aspartate symporter [bioreactor metagenome]|uniref:Proton/glutamate-aspartate symporter n=1 Tax=bioreactor metagenome TaxID=1076179 RepID=A0A644TMD8_9ZZZZ
MSNEQCSTGFMKKFPLWAQILVGLVLGVFIGYQWPALGTSLQPLGLAFIKAIKMVVMPLVFSAVTLGIYRMGSDFKQLGRLGIMAFAWFYLATGISIMLGIGLNAIFHPGAGVELLATGKVPVNLATHIDWVKFFLDIIPDNIVNAVANQKIIPTLFFAICFGLCLGSIGEKGKPVVKVLDGILEAMFKLTSGIVATAPVAVAGIMAWVLATQGGKMLYAMAKLIGTLYIGLLCVMLIFWVILIFLKMPPIATTKKVLEPLLLAFTTCSSEVTLPVHMEILERTGIPNKIVSFVLPLGYSFNLDGAALYQSLAVCFLADVYQIPLDAASIVTILITTLIANKGTANVPSASLVVLAVILTSIGLPVEAIAILAGVDRFMDMGRTTINVFGNTVAALLLHRFGGVPDDETPSISA